MRHFLIHLITILITIFLSISCNNDDENNPNTKKNTIIGRWKLIKYEDNGKLSEANKCKQKSIVEFKSDNTFTNIAVIDSEMDSSICVFDGFGTSGTFEIANNILTTTNVNIIAIPDDLNVPQFIEEAKGKNDPQTISFDNEKLVLSETIIDGEKTLNYKFIYEKTKNDFFDNK